MKIIAGSHHIRLYLRISVGWRAWQDSNLRPAA
jgi:hypothetical protein